MTVIGGLFDILGAAFAIVFVLYWAFAGRIIIEKEKNWILKVFFLAALLAFPVFSPLVIYFIYYRHVIPAIKNLFRPKARNITIKS